jgi:hypothetical protein
MILKMWRPPLSFLKTERATLSLQPHHRLNLMKRLNRPFWRIALRRCLLEKQLKHPPRLPDVGLYANLRLEILLFIFF